MIKCSNMEIQNGDILKFKNDERHWVAIHYTNCDMSVRVKHNKHNKNHTGFYLFSGLWYEGDKTTSEPYGKCIERLERGMFPMIEIVGNVQNELTPQIF